MCCLLAGGLSVTPLHAETLKQADTATLNMEDADIKTLISTVAEKTGKNFIVDPRVKGKVTVISHEAVSREELYQIFLSILEVHGFAAVPSGKSIKIIPDASAKQSGGSPNVAGRGDEVVTRVVNVDYVNAMQLVPILRPLIPQQGHMAAFPQSNVLIISDRADNIARILRIIKSVDRPANEDVEVIRLEHASSGEMVHILTALQQAKGGKPEGGGAKLVADERTNSILLGGDKAERLQMRALISHLDTPTDTTGNTQVVYLNYADAPSLVPVLTSVSSGLDKKAGKPGAQGSTGNNSIINIQADENTNALVITAPPDLMRSLQAVIRQLDIRRAQVLVEAVIAEVSSSKSSELGVQWAVDGSTGGRGPIAGTNFPGSGTGILGIIADPVGSIPNIGNGLSLGLGNNSSDNRFAVLLRALASDDQSNVLSTPSLVMLDNEESEIVVGQNVPFVTGSQQTTGGLANPFQTIQRQDVGLTLKVKPQINEGNAIKMDIVQEISSVVPDSTSGAADIVTNKRSIKTSVLADDGSIVILGGLIQDDLKEGESKVPLLGDIPLLGGLFRSKTSQKVKTNLMVFIHPVILRDARSGSYYATRKYNYIRAEQVERKKAGVALLPDDVAPVLPPIEEFLELPPPFAADAKVKAPQPEQDAN
jgi:general secretion pathway protein D